MNSDLFTNIDFEDFFLSFKSEDSDIMVASIPYSLKIPYGVLTIKNEDILGIEEKPTYNHYVNAGIY
jgi:NDP-sugar pyrophosphorylase family protein